MKKGEKSRHPIIHTRSTPLHRESEACVYELKKIALHHVFPHSLRFSISFLFFSFFPPVLFLILQNRTMPSAQPCRSTAVQLQLRLQRSAAPYRRARPGPAEKSVTLRPAPPHLHSSPHERTAIPEWQRYEPCLRPNSPSVVQLPIQPVRSNGPACSNVSAWPAAVQFLCELTRAQETSRDGDLLAGGCTASCCWGNDFFRVQPPSGNYKTGENRGTASLHGMAAQHSW